MMTCQINTKLNVSDVLTKAASREVFAFCQQVMSGQIPWPEIPDSETALKNQIASVQLQYRERSDRRMQSVEMWESLC